MKRKSAIILVLSLFVTFCLGGCGTPMYEITDEEEALIVQYSAYALGRFNTYQKDGMQYYRKELYEMPEPVVPQAPPIVESEDVISPDITEGGIQASENASMENAISFSDAIGYANVLSVNYQGIEQRDNYKEGNYYSIDAKAGKQIIVAKFSVTNTTDEEKAVDIMKEGLSFQISIDGGKKWISEDVTLLLYDLSSYVGTISAKATVDMVLLFEVAKDVQINTSDIRYSVVRNGTSYSVY